MLVTLPRIGAVLVVFPLFGSSVVTGLTRGVIGLSLASFLYPHVADTLPAQALNAWMWAAVIAKETFIGLLIGFVTSLFFWVMQNVGHLVDFQTGAGSAAVFDPAAGHEGGPTAGFLSQLATGLFVAGGGLTLLLGVVYGSYRVWPIFSFFPDVRAAFESIMLREVDSLMIMTVKLATPIVLVLLIAELSLGLVNRFAPQLNVFMVAMPIKAILAVIMLVVSSSVLLEALHTFYASERVFLELLRGVF